MAEYAKCKDCGADIMWSVTEGGSAIPLDAGGQRRMILIEDMTLHRIVTKSVKTYMPHHATCPKAAEFRKGKDR